MLYNDYIPKLHNKFLDILDDIEVDYNFDYGDEFEISLCEMLRQFLPIKYGVCRGCVVTSDGRKSGDDIIIYDQELFPTLRLRDNSFGRKENIPCEAVYAYIEAKNSYSKDSDPEKDILTKAFKQVKNVKELCNTREKRGYYQQDPYIIDSRNPNIEHLPSYRNPVLGIIICRQIKGNKDIKTVQSELQTFMGTLRADINNPEVIIAGESNGLFIGYINEDSSIPTLFALPEENGKKMGYQNKIKEHLMFGIFLSHLMAAVDYIRLDKMPWVDILNEAKEPNKDDLT